MPQADLSVWVGVIAPALPVLGLCQREGTPLGRVSDAACRKRAAYSRSAWSSEAPIPLPGNSPAMVPAAVAASRACRFRLWTWAPPPRRSRRALCAGHPLHPMTAGHATDPNQGRDYRYRCPDRHCLRIGYSRSPGGAAKAVLSPSSPPPERPPASFSRRRARFWRRQRACCVISTLVDRCPDRRPGLPRLRF